MYIVWFHFFIQHYYLRIARKATFFPAAIFGYLSIFPFFRGFLCLLIHFSAPLSFFLQWKTLHLDSYPLFLICYSPFFPPHSFMFFGKLIWWHSYWGYNQKLVCPNVLTGSRRKLNLAINTSKVHCKVKTGLLASCNPKHILSSN